MYYLLSVVIPLFLYSFACYGLGYILSIRFQRESDEIFFIKTVLAFVLGQGAYGVYFHLPALLGTFAFSWVLMSILPFSLLGGWKFRSNFSILSSEFNVFKRFLKRAQFLHKICIYLIIFILIFSSFSASAPLDGDAQAFYMVLPKLLASTGTLSLVPSYENFSVIGVISELQLAALFLMGMPGGSPRLFIYLTSICAVVLLYGIGKQLLLGKNGLVISVAILVTSSAFIKIIASGKTDLFALVFAMAAYYFAIRQLLSKEIELDKRSIMTSGFLSGCAVVAKLSYLVAFLPSVVLLMSWGFVKKIFFEANNHIKRGEVFYLFVILLGLFGLAFLMPILGLIAKNFILYGDPLKMIGSEAQWFNAATTRWIVLTYPLVLVYGHYWAQMGNMSVLMLILVPLMFVFKFRGEKYSSLILATFVSSLFSLVLWVVFFPAAPMIRYFLAPLVLMIVGFSYVAEKYLNLDRTKEFSLMLIIVISQILFIVNNRKIFDFKYTYLNLVNLNENRFSKGEELESLSVYDAINKEAPIGSRVYTFTYFKFHLRPDLIQNATTSDEFAFLPDWKNDSSGSFWRSLEAKNFSYILLQTNYNLLDVNALLESKPEWVILDELKKNGNWVAYRVVFKE